MNRRNFTKTTAAGLVGATLLGCASGKTTALISKKPTFINNLYYRANTWHFNPKHIAADMDWMADHGSHAITIALSETDFSNAPRNIETIVRTAHDRGLKVLFVTSRWAGIFAGAPKAPSLFAAKNPQTWSLKADGKPYFHSSGPICSIYYPEVFEFFTSKLKEAFQRFDLDGVMWDEPKAYQLDFAPKGKAALSAEKVAASPYDNPLDLHIANYCEYISTLNDVIKMEFPNKQIHFFAYPYLSEFFVEKASEIRHLDYYGADGRAYPKDQRPATEKGKKYLLGEGATGFRYVEKAKEKGIKSMVLIENFRTILTEHPLLEKYLDDIIPNVDQFAYYYYPRSCETPDKTLEIITRKLKKYT
ncbi:MAG: hypothetical protein AAF960_06850 [Bacteroidota bacterium]